MIEMTLVAVAMILIGVLLRTLFIGHIPKITFVMIWGLVLARLLIPFSTSSPFSVWNLIEYGEIIEITQGGRSQVREIIIPEDRVPQMNAILEQEEQIISNSQVTEVASDINWVGVIWLLGVGLSGSYFVFAHYKFRKETADSLPVSNEFVIEWLNKHQLKRTIQVRESYKISSPLTYGIFKPVILMPKITNWQDENQLNYVFTHELVHICRFDYAMKIILAIALCIHWFNPFVWIMYVLANRDIELSCDESVLKILGYNKKSAYALALLEMEENRIQFPVLASNFSKNAIEERIQLMIKKKKEWGPQPFMKSGILINWGIIGATLSFLLVGGAMTVFAAPLSSMLENPLIEGERTLMDYESFREWMEYRMELEGKLWGVSEDQLQWKREWFEDTLENIKNGGTVYLLDSGELGFVLAPIEGDYEVATYDSFRAWMEQDLLEIERTGLHITSEIERIREFYEEILNYVKNGAEVLLMKDGFIIMNPLNMNLSMEFEDAAFITELDYNEFIEWLEETSTQRELSGEYSEQDQIILRNRYKWLKEVFYRNEETRVWINENGEYMGVNDAGLDIIISNVYE